MLVVAVGVARTTTVAGFAFVVSSLVVAVAGSVSTSWTILCVALLVANLLRSIANCFLLGPCSVLAVSGGLQEEFKPLREVT